MYIDTATMKDSMEIPLKKKKVGIKPPYDPAISLLGIYPEDTKMEKDTCIPLFTATLYTTARTLKQPRCPLTNEWMKKLWYIYTMEYYSAIKRNTFESVLMRCMNLEPITQSEVSQTEKDNYCILTHIYEIQKNSTEELIYRAAMEKQRERDTEIYGHEERGGEGEMYGKSNMETYITTCKIDSQQEFAVWLRKLIQELCINLEVWDGVERWEGVSKGKGYMYTYG